MSDAEEDAVLNNLVSEDAEEQEEHEEEQERPRGSAQHDFDDEEEEDEEDDDEDEEDEEEDMGAERGKKRQKVCGCHVREPCHLNPVGSEQNVLQ